MTAPIARRAPEAGVTLIEMLVVLALFAVVAAAVVLAVPGQQRTASTELERLALEARIDAAVTQTLTSGQPFAIWQPKGDLVILHADDMGRWEVARDPRLNPVKLISQHARMSFQRDDKDVFPISSVLVPERGERLRIVAGGEIDLHFDGVSLVGAQMERRNAAAQGR